MLASGIYSESYRQDLRLRRGALAHLGTAICALGVVGVPFIVSTRWQSTLVLAAIAATGALGIHVLTGLSGQVSLGQAAFLGVGAYSATWFGSDLNLPLVVWLPASGVVAALVGLAAAPLATRMRGIYSLVVTLGLVFIADHVFRVWTSVTGGPNGRSMVQVELLGENLHDGLSVGPIQLTGGQAWYFFAIAVLLVAAFAAVNIQRTRLGRALTVVRDRDIAASVAGIPVLRTKITAFVVSSFLAGIAGALLGAYLSYVVPGQWSLALSVQYIAMIVIGGYGTSFGAIAGAFFVVAIPEVVRTLADLVPLISVEADPSGGLSVELISSFLYGAAIVAVLVVEPKGVLGIWRRVKNYWKGWPWTF
ncbi:MAG: branched-chain amino acid ABC transporter permease [Acidimicrobiia bacterium]